jgi:hypothetical protein
MENAVSYLTFSECYHKNSRKYIDYQIITLQMLLVDPFQVLPKIHLAAIPNSRQRDFRLIDYATAFIANQNATWLQGSAR